VAVFLGGVWDGELGIIDLAAADVGAAGGVRIDANAHGRD
jgi:hypothetical protein